MAQTETKDIHIYSFEVADSGTFKSVVDYEKILNPTGPSVYIQFPTDWLRPSAFRLNEIIASDYILFKPIYETSLLTRVLEQKSVATHQQEFILFTAWFSGLKDDNGVRVVSETSLRLLKVIDRVKLRASLDELMQSYSWSPIFLEANPKP